MTVEAKHLRSAIKPRRRSSAARRPVLHGLILGLVSLSAFFSYHFSPDFPFRHQQAGVIAGLSLPSVGPAQSGQSVLTSGVLPITARRQDPAGGLQPQVAAQLPSPAATPSQPFQLYTVLQGDTASAIASRFGIGLQYLLAANSDMRDGELLNVGQMLIIPPDDGLLYHVRYGETLSDVAARYGVTVQDIISWGGNGITSPDQLSEGQLVFVPGAIPPVSVLPEPPVAVVAVSAPPAAAPPVAAADTGPTSDHGLIWPVTGPISSYYGPSHPLGIDIDLFNNPYAAVAAATSGTVIFAGGDPCCSWGYHVIVMSPGGIETLYAHFSSFAVSVGQTVSQGDILGNAGCTGYCTGNHLHFEVIDNGVRVDPLAYLP